MTPSQIPDHDRLSRRWRMERVVLWTGVVTRWLCVVFALLLVALLIIRGGQPGLAIVTGIGALSWLVAGLVLMVRYLARPPEGVLARRADHMIGLPDNLLSLSETKDAAAWHAAALDQTRRRMDGCDVRKAWPVRMRRGTVISLAAALLLTAATAGVGWMKFQAEQRRLAAEEAERQARLAAAEETLKDWEEFSRLTDDPELKKLFTEAARLREALNAADPREAMREMNRMEAGMSAMEQGIERDSLSPQAARMAEALESFEGMSAMSAALRNKNFPAASDEAAKLAEKLRREAEKTSGLNRAAAVAEMLETEAKTASQRGNSALSNSMNSLSQAAKAGANSSQVPNSSLAKPLTQLQGQFAQEAARKLRGRALSLSKVQIESLRRKLRKEDDKDFLLLPSLCKSCCSAAGGSRPGSGTAGPPKGEQTNLAEAKTQGAVNGAMGEGESEIRTLSAGSGSGAAVSAGRQAAFSDYVELSRQAVEDENLPLAHRRLIQIYFERIRPVAENQKP